MKHFDIVIIGAGLAGNMVALGAAKMGLKVALVSLRHPKDWRTTMLMDEGVYFLKHIDVWNEVQHAAAPVSEIKIFDTSDHFVTAPTVTFSSSEIGLDVLGYNFRNDILIKALDQAVAQSLQISFFESLVEHIFVNKDKVCLILSTGEILYSDFVVGSDGRNSIVRKQLGFGEKQWSYLQTALVLNFKHDFPHYGQCIEFHLFPGPFTQVPLLGNQSSLVWVMNPDVARIYLEMPLDKLSLKIEENMYSMLGKIEVLEGVQCWPLSGMVAHQFGKGRMAIVGEAAHVLPPIGAQGFNISMRDIILLLKVLENNRYSFSDAGDRFHKLRRGSVIGRTVAIDLFNRSLLSQGIFFNLLRVTTFHSLEKIKPLRQLVTRTGLLLHDDWKYSPFARKERIFPFKENTKKTLI
ncbi:2-octaprenyl-6-methoxyphenyl hydroxylase [Liberibacter crescens BT-1]|uniref:2-octaprenyl-6-methoxyphenyl hydroxylase n=1 Tax=Liberibacter crescens (strain BT-1) TaxID=1215343 RepID=L0EUC9_LIBCB|nr:FAD-dependent monooxygenase [Liberibacter crescens]AGA64552.1 2-octaprenyl-6-methoxyphenyl hydroxylase [Liberibacter crescens BT-1]